MTSRWAARVGPVVSLVLLLAGLAGLQVTIIGVRLAYTLPGYIVIAVAALIACASVRGRSSPSIACLGTAAVFCGYIALRALTSPSEFSARPDLFSILAAATVYGLTAIVLTATRTRMVVLAVLLGVATCHVLVCLVQFGLGDNLPAIAALHDLVRNDAEDGIHGRASGLMTGPDQLAGLLEVIGIFGVSLACWSRWPKWSKVVLGYLALVCYIGVALTGSRGGYLSSVASLIVFALLSLTVLGAGGRSLFWRWGAVGLIVLIIAGFYGGALMRRSHILSQRLDAIVDIDHGRLQLWEAAIEQWKLRPWVGTGGGTYRFYGRQFRSEQMQQDPVAVHNDYLHLLCEYGVLGAAAFLAFFVVHLWRAGRSFVDLGPKRVGGGSLPLGDRLALNIGAIGAVSAYVVHSAVDFNLHIPGNALLLAFAFGMLANAGSSSAAVQEGAQPRLFPTVAVAAVSGTLLISSAWLLPGEYHGDRARLALEREDAATAVSLAKHALTYEQKNPRIFFYLGRALVAIGTDKVHAENRREYYEAALTAFDRARLLNPLDGEYPLEMGMLYDAMSRYAEAEWMYGLARERDPRLLALGERYRTHLRLWAAEE